MRTLIRWLLLAVLFYCPNALASDDSLAAYQRCWESADLQCMERLFTQRAWKKYGPWYVEQFSHDGNRTVTITVTHETKRRWFGRRILVTAGQGTYDGTSVYLVGGLELNRRGLIRKVHRLDGETLAEAEQYANRWPVVQEQVKQHRVATFGDVATTACGIAKYGTGAEANPLARVVFGIGPIPGAVVWFTGADSLTQWSYERDFWRGLGPMPDKTHNVALGIRWGVVAHNALACFS